MKKKIQNVIKYNRIIYLIYFYVMSFLIRFMGIFIKTDDHLILFNSFAGRKYDDSPKAVFEGMKKDGRFQGYSFVWAFHDPDRFEVDGAKKNVLLFDRRCSGNPSHTVLRKIRRDI